MKTLIILRHGKTESYSPEKSDYERRLLPTGRDNVAEMGKYMASGRDVPDYIFSSSATRTRETAILAAKTLNFPEEKIDFREKLYLVSANTIVKILATTPDWVANCLLIGHNPGLTELVNLWGVRLDNLPTASAACFSFEGNKWSDCIKSKPTFEWIKLAKDL